MTILHYIPSISALSGGIGAYMQILAHDLGQMCNLHVVTHIEDELLELENCTVHYIPQPESHWEIAKTITYGGQYKKHVLDILKNVKPDLVHVNTCWLPLCGMMALWVKKVGYKVILSPHGMLEPYIMRRHYITKKIPAILMYQKRALRNSDVIHVTAESEKTTILNLGWNQNIYVIPNCVRVKSIKVKKDWHRKKKILFLSRIHVKKGINFLIEAVAQLKDRLQGYTVTIAGPGEQDYITELTNYAKEKHVADIIEFIGPVFGHAKWPLFIQADIFVLPTHSENFGIVIPEALASGTPVITTHGTPWEELPRERCGWWVPIGTEGLTTALEEYLRLSDEELMEMGQNGRRLVIDKYSDNAIACQFIDMYKKIIGQQNGKD